MAEALSKKQHTPELEQQTPSPYTIQCASPTPTYRLPKLELTTDFVTPIAYPTGLLESFDHTPIPPDFSISARESQYGATQESGAGAGRRIIDTIGQRSLNRARLASSRGDLGRKTAQERRPVSLPPLEPLQALYDIAETFQPETTQLFPEREHGHAESRLALVERTRIESITGSIEADIRALYEMTLQLNEETLQLNEETRRINAETDRLVQTIPPSRHTYTELWESITSSTGAPGPPSGERRVSPPSEGLYANLTYVPSLPALFPADEFLSQLEWPTSLITNPSELADSAQPLDRVPHGPHQGFAVPTWRDVESTGAPLIPLNPVTRRCFENTLPKPESQACVVCSDLRPLWDFPMRVSHCNHPSQTCRDCFETWIASSIESNGLDRITCAQCSGELEYEDIKSLASAETFARYDTLTTRAALSTIPNFLWCPSLNCTSGQVHHGDPEHFPLFNCVACQHSFCTNHPDSPDPVPSHPNESCEAYNTRISMSRRTHEQLEQERWSEWTLQKFAKQCPGPECGWWIEKKDGCDHMTCSRCRWEFCWLCKADYVRIRKRGNTEHEKGCRYNA